MGSKLVKKHVEEIFNSLHKLFLKEEMKILEGDNDEVCSICGNDCNLCNGDSSINEFSQSLVPEATTLHRCRNWHQWLTGKFGRNELVANATNKNFLDEVKQLTKENKIELPNSTQSTSIMSYHDYVSELVVDIDSNIQPSNMQQSSDENVEVGDNNIFLSSVSSSKEFLSSVSSSNVTDNATWNDPDHASDYTTNLKLRLKLLEAALNEAKDLEKQKDKNAPINETYVKPTEREIDLGDE